MDMVRVLAVGVLGTMLALTLGKLGGAQGLLVSIATGCVLLVMLLGQAEGLLAFARSLMGEGTFPPPMSAGSCRCWGYPA